MKTLILGCNGQLGVALQDSAPSGISILPVDLPDIDITDKDAVMSLCGDCEPDLIVNAAAYTAVDKAESEPDLAAAVNAHAPGYIAAAASSCGARLIHVSTDFVFDGDAKTPYGPDAETGPLGVYGRTKRDGELAVLEASPRSAVVLRTAWLYSRTGSNFVKTMLRLMLERDQLGVVADQRGAPTWADGLARVIWSLAAVESATGVLHWSDGGEATWFEFATAIMHEALALGLLKKPVQLYPIATEDYPTAATRPRYSVLDCSATAALTGIGQAPWRENLKEMLKGFVA